MSSIYALGQGGRVGNDDRGLREIVKALVGYLVRLTTCKRLTDCLPKLSLITKQCLPSHTSV